MMTREALPARRLLGAAYLAAALVWLGYCLVGSGVMLYHKAEGEMPQTTLTAADLRLESFVGYGQLEGQTAPDTDPNWYLSTDNDPQLLWDTAAAPVYLERVRLDARHKLPAGSVMLYYLRPGQTEYREDQKVYGSVDAEGRYNFVLGGKTISALRIDPDSVGGVPTNFTGVELNPTAFWGLRFWPGGGGWLLLLGLPPLAAAAIEELWRIFGKR